MNEHASWRVSLVIIALMSLPVCVSLANQSVDQSVSQSVRIDCLLAFGVFSPVASSFFSSESSNTKTKIC